MQRLRVRLHRLVGEHRCRIAAALDERHARDQRIARELFEREHQRLLDHAVDDKLVLLGIDIRQAGMIDREVQAVGRDRAVEQMMRRAGMRIAEFVVRIASRPHHVLLEP